MIFSVFISCPRGLEYLLQEEVATLGIKESKANPRGIYCQAEIKDIYKICMWSRIASRVQVILLKGEAFNQKMLYDLCRQFSWGAHFDANKSLAIEFHGKSQQIRNSMFGGQVIKDAIVDYFRETTGDRPSIAKEDPDILLHAFLKNNIITVSLDMSGFGLHQRGYRLKNHPAPIKENVAAAMLIRGNWPRLLEQGYSLYDPFCGSGTIIIEAALMAANIAPGLVRHRPMAFVNWKKHQPEVWQELVAATKKEIVSVPQGIQIKGSDISRQAIKIATESAELANVKSMLNLNHLDFCDFTDTQSNQGLVISNLPYGERLSDPLELKPLYKKLGEKLHKYFQGWQAAILTYNPLLAKEIGLQAHKKYKLFNAQLECQLYCIELNSNNQLKEFSNKYIRTASAEMFANRLQKNFQHLRKWAKRNSISCYRVYDADLPEYAYAIDIYEDNVVLQEYKAPATIPEKKAQKHRLDVINVTPEVLGIPKDNLIEKVRQRQKGKQQYNKIANTQNFMHIFEGRAKLRVNLKDYLDTGLFLDHRPIRLKLASLAPNTKFLNCYCYTASASVHAALAGAITTNIDLSNTYINWAQENFKANNINLKPHAFIRQDCLEWLENCQDKFDVIFLDPPSFSNSKSMESTLDIQRDHTRLITAAMRLLNPNGTLYFSTNFRKFKLDKEVLASYQVKDISFETIDVDFKRNTKIHQCFTISNTYTDNSL